MKKKLVRLTENDLHRIVENSVKRILKERRDSFDNEKFNQWKDKDQIPSQIMEMVNFICEKIGLEPFQEETIVLRNRGGYVYGYGKGFTMSYCTSSYEDGPGTDYSSTLLKFIKGLGFSIEKSYGDNGMDSATNYQDTYWNYDIVYKPSIVYKESFMIWGDENGEDEDDYYDDEDDYYDDEYEY